MTRPHAVLTRRAPDDPDLRSVAQQNPLLRWLRVSGSWVLVLDVALIVVFTLLSRHLVFFSAQNFQSTALAASTGLLLALALGMLLSAGVIDLSVGSNLVLSSVVGALTMRRFGSAGLGPHALLAILAGLVVCIACGAAFGLVNALTIEVLGVNSFIATLGTLGIGTGIALIVTGGADLTSLPPQIQDDFGFRPVIGIPLPAIVALIIAIGLWAIVRFTRFGMRNLAIGSSRMAAERAGINVRRHLIALVIAGGAMAGLAGFFSLATFGSTTLASHSNDALNAITAAVIGGVALAGGRINISGIVYGAILAVVLDAGLSVIGVSSFYQLIAVGVVLIFAVALDHYNTQRSMMSLH